MKSYKLINSTTISDDDPDRQSRMIGFFVALDDFMKSRHNYKRSKLVPYVNKVDAKCSKFTVSIRFGAGDDVSITAIQFKDRRKGHCAALVEFIDSISETYRIPSVEFISVESEGMRAFVMKNRFKNREPCWSPISHGLADSPNWYRPTKFGCRSAH